MNTTGSDADSITAYLSFDQPVWKQREHRIKRLMTDLGMPNSISLSEAMKQLIRDVEYMDARTRLSDPAQEPDAVATVTYTNWRGETSVRRIIPKSVRHGSTEWHPEPQWLLLAFDVDKQADREFALKDFGTRPVSLDREALARIIDPDAWANVDHHRKVGLHGMADNYIGDTLTKADAILALIEGRT